MSQQKKQLILTGDDFGASSRVNEAIEKLHKEGALTQASLMIDGAASEEALRIAQRHPGLCVGLHLVLAENRPALNGLRFFFDLKSRVHLTENIQRQAMLFRASGLNPTYWDGHMHLHLHPTVARIALPILTDAGFHGVRLMREDSRGIVPHIFRALSNRAIPDLQQNGLRFTDRTFGLVETGKITTTFLTDTIAALPTGLSEIYFHPGAEPSPIDGRSISATCDQFAVQRTTLLSA